jgi:ribosomal protein S2
LADWEDGGGTLCHLCNDSDSLCEVAVFAEECCKHEITERHPLEFTNASTIKAMLQKLRHLWITRHAGNGRSDITRRRHIATHMTGNAG